MPKAFTPKEKTAIRATLFQVGLKRFAASGVRAARVDDICRDAGIAKGSFYAFFASKEDLFMTIANARDEEHKQDLRAHLVDTHGTPEQVTGAFFDAIMQRIETDPVLKIVKDTGEIQYLLRKVSPALMAENAQRDKAFLMEAAVILRDRHKLPHADGVTLEGLMTLMLSMGTQAEFIAASGDYAATRALLRDMFVSRLVRGPYA